jgi:lysophospholipase L1-like esterase
LWNAFLNQPPNPEWSPDGGHAGPKGMDRILEMICDNLITKGWFDEK